MSFEWDYLKAARNLQKHNVDFADAVTALDDALAITICEETSGEERFVTLGRDALDRLLVVVYTWRGDRIRVISARKATRRERRQYGSYLL
ncbi:MAG TPA: BrnT family toxin [Acidobacteriota bacterium]|nr:BrnT family toxin [Acidobacteriota bacterium]